MKNIKIIANASYLPKNKIKNAELAEKLCVTEEFILQRTGIKSRYIACEETLEEMAICAAKRVLEKARWNKEEIGMIVVATTSTKSLMPSIAFKIQKALDIQNCNCMDILAGCAGYITALEVARNAIAVGKTNAALVIGADKLSNYINKEDLGTAVVLSDGAGATLIVATKEAKKFESHIQADGADGDMLTCYTDKTIQMNGTKVYRYAVTQTVQNIKELLKIAGVSKEEIDYIVPHQSNRKIMDAMAQRLHISKEKMFMNIEEVGNTFCASIPIALSDMEEKKALQENQKIILLGYGGGLNTASILLEL